jgi:putative glutathione S-transferase
MLINGKWNDKWTPYQGKDDTGRFIRQISSFRNRIEEGGQFPPEIGRYHLYIAYICPWASRTLMMLKLKNLDHVISVSVVNPRLTDQGWSFNGFQGSTADPHLNASYMHEIYSHADPEFTGKATVPVLWDKQTQTIVNNESADICEILNEAFDDMEGVRSDIDLYPSDLKVEIDNFNDWLYPNFNNGVYLAGFAQSQKAYGEAVSKVFMALDEMEKRLEGQTYLIGNQLTFCDIRAFVTLIRFDAAYVGLFKCNLRTIADYPNLSAYVRRVYQLPGIKETVHFHHIKAGYYSIKALNPNGIIPHGPKLNYLFD